MKELYVFTIQKKEEDKSIPVKVFIKKPNARDSSILSLVFAAELSKALKMGIMSEVDIRRTVQDAGGFKHSKSDKSRRDKLLDNWNSANNKRQLLLAQEKNTDKITNQIISIKKEIEELDNGLRKVLENSAEVVAYQRTLDWMTTNLTFWDEDKSPVFAGETDEERMDSYFAAIDNETLANEVIKKSSVLLQGFLMNGVKEKEIFAAIEAELDEIAAKENIP